MPLDDRGNPQIDFVWGSLPLQPNFLYDEEYEERTGPVGYPGDGEAEWVLKGYADPLGQSPANYLTGKSNHSTALRGYQGYPAYDPNSGFQHTVDWWESNIPAFEFPNIPGLDIEDAKAQLIECGVDPVSLVDLEFDTEDPELRYVGYSPETGYLDPVAAPGSTNPGVIAWRYYEPNDVIGQHWDGSPWLAKESENKVIYTASWIGEQVPAVAFEGEGTYFTWWHSFVVIQTKDPFKNSYIWWND